MNKNCPTCKKDFCKKRGQSPAHFKRLKFCSRVCYYESIEGKLPWNTGIKGLHFSPTTEFKKGDKGHLGYKHTEGTKHKMGLAKLGKFGEQANNWRGGSYPLNMLIRRSQKYRQWRTAVFERDNYTCQECGSKNGNGKTINLNADHIEAFSALMIKHGVDSVQSALICADLWNIKNGRTLCIDCHKKTDNFGVRAMQKLSLITNH